MMLDRTVRQSFRPANGDVMRTLVVVCTAWVIAAIPLSLRAQEFAPTHDEQSAAMNKLASMVGQWKGDGWIEMGPQRFQFESSEVFSRKAGGLALLVEGIHRMPIPTGESRVIHNAVAMITYDADADRYRFITQLANGRGGDYHGTITADGDFQWIIPDTPMGKMTYTISVEDGKYSEIGELTLPSGERKKFFEMNLTKSKQ